MVGERDHRDLSGPAEPLPKVNTRPVRRGRLFGIRAGQLVSTQIAAVVLLIGAGNGTIALFAAGVVAVGLLALTWLRLRGRWVFEWIAIAMRFTGRRHTAPVDTAPTALLEFVAPGARVEPTDLA